MVHSSHRYVLVSYVRMQRNVETDDTHPLRGSGPKVSHVLTGHLRLRLSRPDPGLEDGTIISKCHSDLGDPTSMKVVTTVLFRSTVSSSFYWDSVPVWERRSGRVSHGWGGDLSLLFLRSWVSSMVVGLSKCFPTIKHRNVLLFYGFIV